MIGICRVKEVKVFIIQKAQYVSHFNKLTKVQDRVEQEVSVTPAANFDFSWLEEHYKDARPLEPEYVTLYSQNIEDLF